MPYLWNHEDTNTEMKVAVSSGSYQRKLLHQDNYLGKLNMHFQQIGKILLPIQVHRDTRYNKHTHTQKRKHNIKM